MFNRKLKREYKALKIYVDELELFIRKCGESTTDFKKWLDLYLIEQLESLGDNNSTQSKIDSLKYRVSYLKENFSDRYDKFIKSKNRNNKIDNLLWEVQSE